MELSDIASVVLYLTVFSAAICFAYLGQKKNIKTLYFLAILLPVLLAGFRYSAGTDSLTYRSFYDQIGNESGDATLLRLESGGMEPFIVGVSYVGNLLNLGPSFLFIVFAAITLIFMYATAYKYDKKRAWLYYGVLLFIVFPESFNMMRQIAAISVQAFTLLWLYQLRNEKKHIPWTAIILLLLFSISIHYSSLLLLPVMLLPFISGEKHWRSIGIVLAMIAAVCALAFPTVVETAVSLKVVPEKHVDTLLGYDGSLINVKFVGATILAGILLANYHRRKQLKDRQMAFLMLIGMTFAAVGFYSGYLGRLAMFFWIFILLIGADLLRQLCEKDRTRSAICLLVAVGYFVIYFCVLGFNAIVPYSFAP